MNMHKGLKNKSAGQGNLFTRLWDAEPCPRCGRPIFYRTKVEGRVAFVHGDKSYCVAWRDER